MKAWVNGKSPIIIPFAKDARLDTSTRKFLGPDTSTRKFPWGGPSTWTVASNF